MNLNILPIP
ncbi:hypothetical protein GQ607_011431 [Colletotrichum asianum]|uniref:Uncharacterized protein n=1 Tax=Colletotrichum asianum TaxID=702518 RepID=A0A8H3ZJC8_9PEZI|nr:hypothetical protein GQ607_011431 [Colletotrichum asianum]